MLVKIATVFAAVAASLSIAGAVQAKPADRGGDAVVLKGSSAAKLTGTDPGRIVAFAWKKNRWVQIPVQVDERHTLDARKLYPPGYHPPYVGNDGPTFDVEVYSDPKTRAGADLDPTLDRDDEIAFMGGDAGNRAPNRIGAPDRVAGATGTRVAVKDPVGGGNGWVYLFRANAKTPDQSAGQSYVKYDFNLVNLGPGQTLLNDYGYIHSTNPENSTVTTEKYRLHSYDRWMEDELRVTAGNASGENILDREVAQATLTGCSRSEYTFSGRWKEDNNPGNDNNTDDEGTYVTVIDGPVRAIRSYMGANSGPYVQREHVYYRDYEQNTVFLRVHPMLDLYTWTDFSEAAIGMTYRDLKNPDGVTVDGQPDALEPTTSADVANGAYGWQQLSGPQGTVTTVVGADTDIRNANFGNFYLDQENPDGPNEVQCGGDGKSIGASGFGILGPVTPNTDPRLGQGNKLTVKRIRYFDAPGGGVALGENYAARVTSPLVASASSSSMKKQRAGWKIKLVNRKVTARPGKRVKLRLKVKNSGNLELRAVRLCVTSRKVAGKRCARIGKIGIGKAKVAVIRVKVKRNVRGRKLRLGAMVEVKAGDGGAAEKIGGPAIRIRR